MARKRSSNVSDMQLSFDLWGLEASVPDAVTPASAGEEERNADERSVQPGPAAGSAGGDRPEPSNGVGRRPVSEADGVFTNDRMSAVLEEPLHSRLRNDRLLRPRTGLTTRPGVESQKALSNL